MRNGNPSTARDKIARAKLRYGMNKDRTAFYDLVIAYLASIEEKLDYIAQTKRAQMHTIEMKPAAGLSKSDVKRLAKSLALLRSRA